MPRGLRPLAAAAALLAAAALPAASADEAALRAAFASAMRAPLGGPLGGGDIGAAVSAPAPPLADVGENETCGCPPGNVSDCCCSFADLEEANDRTAHDLLKQIVATPFFSHFRVNLCSTCGLWKDTPLCTLRDCGVCECPEPPAWVASDTASDAPGASAPLGGPPGAAECTEEASQVSPSIVPSFAVKADSWDPSGSTGAGADEYVVVDLRENPERFTGYAGESAARVWDEVHSRNCFQAGSESGGDACAEQRLYNRLISGIHSSISLHIAHTYCLARGQPAWTCAKWGTNAAVAHDRVLKHPDRVENLYVAFAVLLRAVVKAGPAVSAAVPLSDPAFAESLRAWQQELLPELVRFEHACPRTFAEEELFAQPDGGELWTQVQGRLQHLAEVMKCVGCDRCKLWGTLQTQGLAAALKVLFQQPAAGPDSHVALSRQEAVALVHTLERLSSSLRYLREFRGGQ